MLNIPVETFQNFYEELAVNFISNKFDNGAVGYQKNDSCTFNPIDKIVQMYDDKIALYDRMFQEKDAMRLEELIKGQ